MENTYDTHNTSRRTFLRNSLYVVGGTAAVAAGGLGWRAWQEDVFQPFDGPAYAPWTTWRTTQVDGPAALVQMAILSASPHNTQPWLFRPGKNRIQFLADGSRDLGSFDPFRREMQIGVGCAIETATIAAPAHGYATDVRYTERRLTVDPGDGPVPAATVVLHKTNRKKTPLFKAISHRHTDRNGYDRSRPAPLRLLQAFTNFAQTLGVRIDLFESGSARTDFDALVSDATAAIVADHSMVQASEHWLRTTPEAIAAHRDGLTLDTMGLPPLTLFAAKILPPTDAETTHQYWLRQTREVHLPTARMTGLISIRDRYSAVSVHSTTLLLSRYRNDLSGSFWNLAFQSRGVRSATWLAGCWLTRCNTSTK